MPKQFGISIPTGSRDTGCHNFCDSKTQNPPTPTSIFPPTSERQKGGGKSQTSATICHQQVYLFRC